MLFRSKFLSILALFAAFAMFSMNAAAQDDSGQPAKDGTAVPQKPDGKRFGRRPHGEGFRGERGGRGGMMRGMRGVNLTDAQKEQIRSVRESSKPDQATMQEMKTLRDAKRNGTLTPEQQQRMKALHQQTRAQGESVHKQIMAILTPEQLQQIEQNKQEMKKKFEERRQMREQNKQPVTDKPTDN